MSWFMPFRRRKTASVARERLQILLTHERGAEGHSDLIPILREEVLAAVAKHVPVDVDKVQIKIERGKAVSSARDRHRDPLRRGARPGEATRPGSTGRALAARRGLKIQKIREVSFLLAGAGY